MIDSPVGAVGWLTSTVSGRLGSRRFQQRAQHGQHLRAGFGAEPAPNARHVVFDGLGRDEQLVADLPVGQTAQEQSNRIGGLLDSGEIIGVLQVLRLQ